MPFYFFTWSDEIIDHLAENDVTPTEFEEIVSHPESEGIRVERPISVVCRGRFGLTGGVRQRGITLQLSKDGHLFPARS